MLLVAAASRRLADALLNFRFLHRKVKWGRYPEQARKPDYTPALRAAAKQIAEKLGFRRTAPKEAFQFNLRHR
jgi:hypothetical protein